MTAILGAKNFHRRFTLGKTWDKIDFGSFAINLKITLANAASLTDPCIDDDTIKLAKLLGKFMKYFKNLRIISYIECFYTDFNRRIIR